MDFMSTAQIMGNFGEFFGAVAVVATLIYLSTQIRQANNIARTQTVMQLHSEYNAINTARFTRPEVARLLLLLQRPDQSEATDNERSMMRGMAYHVHNILWSAQSAYDNHVLSLEDLTIYRNDLQSMIERMPPLLPELIAILEGEPHRSSAYIYEPVAKRAASLQGEPASVA